MLFKTIAGTPDYGKSPRRNDNCETATRVDVISTTNKMDEPCRRRQRMYLDSPRPPPPLPALHRPRSSQQRSHGCPEQKQHKSITVHEAFNKIAIQGTRQMAVDKELSAYRESTHTILRVTCPFYTTHKGHFSGQLAR